MMSDEDKEDHADNRLTLFLQLGIADIAIRCRRSAWNIEACWSLYLHIFLQSCFQVNLHCPRSAPLEFPWILPSQPFQPPRTRWRSFGSFPLKTLISRQNPLGVIIIFIYIFFLWGKIAVFGFRTCFSGGSIQGLGSMCFFIFGICCFSWIFHLDLFWFFSLVFLHELSFLGGALYGFCWVGVTGAWDFVKIREP